MKHVRIAHNPLNGRIYFLGGDYSGPIGMDSGRNEVYSYSIAEDNWILEYPYCGSAGSLQPSHPDEVGWVYDSKRNIFWMIPGYMGRSQKVCPDSTLVRGEIMTFDPKRRSWDWPKRNNKTPGTLGNKKFAQYDPFTDTIVRLAWTSFSQSEVYDIKSDTWSVRRHGSDGYQIGQEHSAMDLERRHIYVIGPKEGRLYRYDMDSRDFREISNLPARGIYNNTWLAWDSVNKVLLWPRMQSSRITKLFVYHPDKREWESLPAELDESKPVVGRHAFYDPYQNVLLVMGGTDMVSNRVFLYRYGNGTK